MRFVAPNPSGVETKLTTNVDKSTVYSFTNSSMVP